MKAYTYLRKKIKSILGIKATPQKTLAERMEEMQGTISNLLTTPKNNDERLMEITEKLNVSLKFIQRLQIGKAVQITSNTFTDSSTYNGINSHCTFNPIDKIAELYERILAAEREKCKCP